MKFYPEPPKYVYLLFVEHFLVMFRILYETRGVRIKKKKKLLIGPLKDYVI